MMMMMMSWGPICFNTYAVIFSSLFFLLEIELYRIVVL